MKTKSNLKCVMYRAKKEPRENTETETQKQITLHRNKSLSCYER